MGYQVARYSIEQCLKGLYGNPKPEALNPHSQGYLYSICCLFLFIYFFGGVKGGTLVRVSGSWLGAGALRGLLYGPLSGLWG